jgi:hypothetical protein
MKMASIVSNVGKIFASTSRGAPLTGANVDDYKNSSHVRTRCHPNEVRFSTTPEFYNTFKKEYSVF